MSLTSTICWILSTQTDLEGCPIEEILLVRDLEKKYGEQCFFTYTAEAFETQMALLKAEEEAEKARLAEEAEVREAISSLRLARTQDMSSDRNLHRAVYRVVPPISSV